MVVERWPSWRTWRVWQRNLTTFKHLWLGNFLGNLADPLFFLLAIGFGLGSMVGEVDGRPYVVFLAPGLVAGSAMMTSCFEATFGSFTRLHTQRTFDAMIATPLSAADVAGGEILWAATKGALSGAVTLAVAAVLGLVASPMALLALPVVLLQGIGFGGLSLAYAARVRSYDAFNHFYALFISPVFFFSDVFIPVEGLPGAFRSLALLSPLTHGARLSRSLLHGEVPADAATALGMLVLAGVVGAWAGTVNLRRRLIG